MRYSFRTIRPFRHAGRAIPSGGANCPQHHGSACPCPCRPDSHSPAWVQWIIVLDVLLLSVWALRFQRRGRFITWGLCILFVPFIAWYLFSAHDTWFPVMTPITAVLCVALACSLFPQLPPPSRDAEDEDEEDDAPLVGRQRRRPCAAPGQLVSGTQRSTYPPSLQKRTPRLMTQRKHILFICTGNTCRSPMAEGLFRKLSAHHPEWQAGSAGTAAWPGQAASPETLHVLREHGVNLSSHESRPVTDELMKNATDVYAMTESHPCRPACQFPPNMRTRSGWSPATRATVASPTPSAADRQPTTM